MRSAAVSSVFALSLLMRCVIHELQRLSNVTFIHSGEEQQLGAALSDWMGAVGSSDSNIIQPHITSLDCITAQSALCCCPHCYHCR